MFSVLIADDDYEDRELLKLEIQRALGSAAPDLRFSEAASVRQALQLLTTRVFDLLTLDIEFDRLNEGLHALPEIFESYPTLNIIVISGKLNKSEVSEQLFRFTKDNVLKGKRWARHFDVLDKKDDKTDALRHAFSFAVHQKESAGKIRELFLLAESYLEKNMIDKCLDVYQRIQDLVPGERESSENIRMFKGEISAEYIEEFYNKGERVAASLLLGHYLEGRLKSFTGALLGRSFPALSDCLKALEGTHLIGKFHKKLFQQLLRLRNKAIHHPAETSKRDLTASLRTLKSLEERPHQ